MGLEPGKNPLISLATLVTSSPPPVEWDLEPLVMHGGRMVLSGEWATFKSWITLDMLLHIAAGLDWLSWRCPKPRKVLYVDEEMPLPELWRRVLWLINGNPRLAPYRVDPGFLERFHLLSQQGFRTDKTAWLTLCLKSWKYAPEVVVVETLRRTLTGSENEASAVATMWQGYQVLTDLGATVWVNHHNIKPAADPKLAREAHHLYAGSADILGGCDQALALTRKRGQAAVRVTHTKARGAKEVDPFHLTLTFDDAHQRACVIPSNDMDGVDPTLDERKMYLPE